MSNAYKDWMHECRQIGWPDDDEEYICECVECGESFTGRRTRMLCRDCAKTLSDEAVAERKNEVNSTELLALLEEILNHAVANRGSEHVFFSCYTYNHGEMPAWVGKAEKMLKTLKANKESSTSNSKGEQQCG